MSQADAQHRARGSDSVRSPRCSVTTARDLLVEADLGVRQVVVVEEDDRRTGLAHQLRWTAVSSPSTSSSTRSPRTELAAGVEVVGADRDAVRAQCRLALRRRAAGGFLADGEGRDDTLGVRLDLRAQHVDAGRLQPRFRPGLQVAAGGLLQRPSRSDRRELPNACRLEVGLHALEERVLYPTYRDELLEHRSRPWRRDAVEVDEHVVQVADVRHDRVRGRQLVLPVRPGLHLVGERRPRVRPLRAGRVILAQAAPA